MNSLGAVQILLRTPSHAEGIADLPEPTGFLLKKFRGAKTIVRSFCVTSRDPRIPPGCALRLTVTNADVMGQGDD